MVKKSIAFLLLVILILPLSAQKSKVVAVKQMIDAEKYEEAKEAIEEAVEHPKTSGWARTYFTRGMLCQTAYEQGVEKNDSKKTSLYPDQLYVAYNSYREALELDAGERMNGQIRQKYYLLSNDFRKMGEGLFAKKDYAGALKAFEHALQIGESELLSADADTNLIFNAAMAAFEGRKWDSAAEYLGRLHEAAYSPSTSLLLSRACLRGGDTIRSEEVMINSLELYNYRDTLVMYAVNYLVGKDDRAAAIDILDRAIVARPASYRFPWARALVYEGMDQYEKAIESLLLATELTEDNPDIYYHLGTCYYNIGIDLRESALGISDNDSYLEARSLYMDRFREAVHWFERFYELDPGNEKILKRLQQLYYQLQMKEKQSALAVTAK